MKPFILGGVAAFATLVPLLVLTCIAVEALHAGMVRYCRMQTVQTPDNTMTGPSNLCVGVHDCHMQTHAYTLDDIDRMRAAERALAAWASASNPLDSVVELRVQTDIAAGITPEELERKVTAKP